MHATYLCLLLWGFFVLVSFGGLGIFTEQVFNNACSPPVLAKS